MISVITKGRLAGVGMGIFYSPPPSLTLKDCWNLTADKNTMTACGEMFRKASIQVLLHCGEGKAQGICRYVPSTMPTGPLVVPQPPPPIHAFPVTPGPPMPPTPVIAEDTTVRAGGPPWGWLLGGAGALGLLLRKETVKP